MKIRRMTEADLPAVMALEERCFSIPWTYENFRELIGRTPYVLLAAEEAGTVQGYAVLMQVFEDGDLMNIAVSPECRRRGIGQELLAEVIRIAGERKVTQLFLEVREHNAQAIRLYEKNGFVFVGRRKDYYEAPREDALIYVRTPKEE